MMCIQTIGQAAIKGEMETNTAGETPTMTWSCVHGDITSPTLFSFYDHSKGMPSHSLSNKLPLSTCGVCVCVHGCVFTHTCTHTHTHAHIPTRENIQYLPMQSGQCNSSKSNASNICSTFSICAEEYCRSFGWLTISHATHIDTPATNLAHQKRTVYLKGQAFCY